METRLRSMTLAFLAGGLVLAWTPGAVQALSVAARQAQGYGPINRSLLNAASLDSIVRPVFINQMADHYVAGAAISIVHEGEILYQGGFGRREVFHEVPVDAEKTIWRIGSITKVLTGVAVMQLVDRGLLDLDAEVNRYLTEFRIAAPFAEPIRVRHLLTHTAGFDQVGLERHAETIDDVRPMGDFLKQYLRPIRAPGTLSCYDTYGITLAGYLVEQRSGLPYAEYLARNLFHPLAMNRSGIVVPPALKDEVAVGYGFAGSWEAEPWEFMNTPPASSVNATVGDMANFMIMLLEGGRFGGEEVLRPSSVRAMLTQQFTNDPDQPGYGFTLFEDKSFGVPAFSHGGSMAGYGAFLYLVPDERLGVFIALNQESGVVQNAVLSALLSGLFPGRPAAPVQRPRLRGKVDLSPFTGTYASNMYHHADPATGWRIRPIELTTDSLGHLVFGGAPAYPVGPHTFQRDDGLLLSFLLDGAKVVRHLVVNQTVYERIR